MSCCTHCRDAEDMFSRRTARRDLRRYHRRGPHATTRHLLRMIEREAPRGGTLIDVGGGVGAIQHRLLETGLDRATQVDASSAYLDASRREAERQGHADRVTYLHGDFVELADGLDPADVVTLDRVVCCYPDMQRIVERSTALARRLYGLSYPREHVPSRIVLGAGNLFLRLRRSEFRVFLHGPREISEHVERQGFARIGWARTPMWEIALFRRGGESDGGRADAPVPPEPR